MEEAEQASADDIREATSPKLDIGLRETQLRGALLEGRTIHEERQGAIR